MKVAVINEYGKIQIEEREIPVISSDQVLVKVQYASVCGSDQHIFKGEFHPRTKLPLVPGHEFSGRIEAVGSKVENYKPGQKVTVDPIIPCGVCPACKREHYPACTSLKLIGIDFDGGFSEYIAVQPDMLYTFPDSVSDENAALIEVLSIGFHAKNKAKLKADDSIAIWGSGKVGQSILHAVKTMNKGKVFMVDINEERLNMAKEAFADIEIINAGKEDPVAKIMALTNEGGVDVAFEAVGHAKELPGRFNPVRSCVKSIRGGGKVCVLGLSDVPVELIMKEMIWKEAELVTSRVSHGEFADTINALSDGSLDPSVMISATKPLDKCQEAFTLLEESPEKYLKILLKISD